jgi:hypothetical protein
MDIATTLSNSKENIYFKMRMIGLLFSVVKLKFLSISNANHKKIMEKLHYCQRILFCKKLLILMPLVISKLF